MWFLRSFPAHSFSVPFPIVLLVAQHTAYVLTPPSKAYGRQVCPTRVNIVSESFSTQYSTTALTSDTGKINFAIFIW